MSPPIQITWRSIEHSAALESRIRELAQRLEKFISQIVHCRVVIELPHKHGHQGRVYEVRIQITIPGGELVAQHEHHERHTHEDPYVAVRDAFRAVRRQLEDHERKWRQDAMRDTRESAGLAAGADVRAVEESAERDVPLSTAQRPGSGH
ncbi:MAG: HPF/RaiA family ribosome-associated protein [Steroidobacteraceae bacterium]